MTWTEWVRVEPGDSKLHEPPRDLDEDEHPAILKIHKMWERGDFDKIDRMVALFESFEAFGTFGVFLQKVVIWLAALFGAWWAISEYIARYLAHVANGK